MNFEEVCTFVRERVVVADGINIRAHSPHYHVVDGLPVRHHENDTIHLGANQALSAIFVPSGYEITCALTVSPTEDELCAAILGCVQRVGAEVARRAVRVDGHCLTDAPKPSRILRAT